jgi:tetratricopeptide (TPR) repeat protein
LQVPKIFWIALVVFQVAFGTAVFIVTKSYYSSGDRSAESPMPAFRAADLPGGSTSIVPPIDLEQARTPDELAQLADTHFANRQYDAAIVLYEQLLQQNRANVDILNNLALTLHYVGRSDEALQRIDEGIAVDASHQRIRLTQGFVLSQVGRSAEAVIALNQAIEIDNSGEIADSARRMLAEFSGR